MSVNFINDTACFSQGFEKEKDKFYKKALILAEGTWTDNKKREHSFPAERLHLIAENTNRFFEAGNTIPLLKDHQKTTDSLIGELDDYVEVRPISENDISSPRHSHLIGKLGLFASKVLIQSKQAIQQIQENLIKAISPGIDVVENCIKEISATPIPAIAGMSLFSRHSSGLFWEEDDSSDELDFEQIKEKFEEYSDHFLQILYNIYKADSMTLSSLDTTKDQLIEQLFDNYVNSLESCLFEEKYAINDLVDSMCTVSNYI